MNDNKYSSSEYDVAILREAQRVIRSYQHISSAITSDADMALDSVIGLIEFNEAAMMASEPDSESEQE